VNLGDVIVQNETIYGDSVNIAARLEQLSAPNSICIAGSVYEQVKSRVPAAYEYLGEQPLRNIGGAVEVWRVRLDAPPSPAQSWRRPATALALPSRPSIAVLPFLNLARGALEDYFADGLTEDIITDLSKFRELFVIARNSSFVFKSRVVSAQEAGRELGVRYLLEGSVRAAGSRLRVTAQLVDAVHGHQVWADRYDRELTDIFDVQDEITRVIVATLVGQMHRADRTRATQAHPDRLEAYGLLLKGQEAFFQYTSDGNALAQQFYRRAIEREPGYARAHAALSRAYNYDWQYGWSSGSEGSLAVALEFAKKAVALDNANARAHAELGFVHLFLRRYDRAEQELDLAASLNPNDPDIMGERAELRVYTRRSEEAVTLLRDAMRLNPHYPDWYLWSLADALYALRRYEEVIAAVEQMHNLTAGRRLLAASHAQLGRLEEARLQAAEVLRLQPGFSCRAWADKQPECDPEETEHLRDGLRKAGLPE
jgi:TolB-like protein